MLFQVNKAPTIGESPKKNSFSNELSNIGFNGIVLSLKSDALARD